MAHAHAADQSHEAGASHSGHHVTPQKTLLKVFGVLVGLTILTVATGTADWIPGVLHIPIALSIAAVKTAFVVMIFMGLKHDNRVNLLIFVLGAIFACVFLVFTLFDVAFRGDLDNVDSITIADRELLMQQDPAALSRLGVGLGPRDLVLGDTVATEDAAADTTGAAADTTGAVPAAGAAPANATAPADTASAN